MKKFFSNLWLDLALAGAIIGSIAAFANKNWAAGAWAITCALSTCSMRLKDMLRENTLNSARSAKEQVATLENQVQDYKNTIEAMNIAFAEAQNDLRLARGDAAAYKNAYDKQTDRYDELCDKIEELTAALEKKKPKLIDLSKNDISQDPVPQKVVMTEKDKKRIKAEMKSVGLKPKE